MTVADYWKSLDPTRKRQFILSQRWTIYALRGENEDEPIVGIETGEYEKDILAVQDGEQGKAV